MSSSRFVLIWLLLPLLAYGDAPGTGDAGGSDAAAREAVSPRLRAVALAVVDGSAAAAEAGAVKQESSADAGALQPDAIPAGTAWLRYALLTAGLVLLTASMLLLGFRLRRRFRDDLMSTRPSRATRPLAFLEPQDGSSRRHAVTGTAYRIGRHSDNDLSIHDASVSRQHAEINFKRSGNFTISDLDSMNGVFVNQKKIDSVTLADGDIVEIGDKSFRFLITEHGRVSGGSTAAQSGESSVISLDDRRERR